MDEVQKPRNSECYTTSSDSFKTTGMNTSHLSPEINLHRVSHFEMKAFPKTEALRENRRRRTRETAGLLIHQ
jgi:hypothetical protein